MAESPFQPSASLDVVGIGNAIVDVLVQTQDSFWSSTGWPREWRSSMSSRLKRSTNPAVQAWKPLVVP